MWLIHKKTQANKLLRWLCIHMRNANKSTVSIDTCRSRLSHDLKTKQNNSSKMCSGVCAAAEFNDRLIQSAAAERHFKSSNKNTKMWRVIIVVINIIIGGQTCFHPSPSPTEGDKESHSVLFAFVVMCYQIFSHGRSLAFQPVSQPATVCLFEWVSKSCVYLHAWTIFFRQFTTSNREYT